MGRMADKVPTSCKDFFSAWLYQGGDDEMGDKHVLMEQDLKELR